MRSSTETLIAAMRILARDIQSGDGVANAAIAEAAARLEELHADHLRDAAKMVEQQARIAELEAQAAIGRRAVEMLRALEWSRPVLNRYGFWAQGCIECGRGRESGHTEKCATAAILRDAWQAESSNSREILDSSSHVRDAKKMVTDRQLAGAVNELRAITIAADALVDRWHTPLWKDAKPTAEYIAALRLAAESARKLLAGGE